MRNEYTRRGTLSKTFLESRRYSPHSANNSGFYLRNRGIGISDVTELSEFSERRYLFVTCRLSKGEREEMRRSNDLSFVLRLFSFTLTFAETNVCTRLDKTSNLIILHAEATFCRSTCTKERHWNICLWKI